MRYRFDGFTPAKQRLFFETIEQTGCIADAVHVARISKTTVARWRKKAPGFEDELERRRALAAGALEKLAWDRAVSGAEEKVIRNGVVVQIRVKPSDAMLRLLLQASNPDKFGRIGGSAASRRQIERELRERIEAEIRDRLRLPPAEEVRERIIAKVEAIKRHRRRQDGAEP